MKQKFQIFISSTYDDLIREREQVIKAVLEMGHIPVGMEMFSAGDDEQWKIIAKKIEESDYYVVILAHRYGSVTKEGISYTEKEYDHAVACGVPVLGFIIDDKGSWNPQFIDKTNKQLKSLKKFKQKVKNKLVNFWSSKEELHALVSIALMKAFTDKPRTGWVRAEKNQLLERLQEITSDQYLFEYKRLMDELRLITNRLTPNANIHDIKYEFESVELTYYINRNGKARIEQVIEMHSLEELFYFSIWIEGDYYCEKIDSIYDMNFKVEILEGDKRNLAYTQISDIEYKKEVAIWFLPYLKKGEKIKVKISYEWNGYFSRLLNLKNDEIELLFRSKNKNCLKHLNVKFVLEEFSSGERVKIVNIGAKMPDEHISIMEYESFYVSNHDDLANSKIHLKLFFDT